MDKGSAMRRARASLHGGTLLFLLALVASCDNETTSPLREVTPLLVVDGDMGALFQSLTITREGVPVTDGTVTVNGVAIPHSGAGLYQGQLPTAVPAGWPLDLKVSAGGATVLGAVNVPEGPVLTAPATGAVFDTHDTITFSWTSATNPDRFVVSMGLKTPNGSLFYPAFPAAGTARELKIPLAPPVSAGPGTTYSVFAYNDGSFTGQVHPDSRMSVRAGRAPGNDVITITNPRSSLLILGNMQAQHQNIWVFQGGWDLADGVHDAVVTVNGVAIPHAGGYPGYYSGELPAAVPPGSPLGLRVSARGLIVEATANVPETPVLTAPAKGAVFAPGSSITVRWTSATNPDRFAVYVNTNRPVWHRSLPGTARELEIAANEIPAECTIYVVAHNSGSSSGPAHPDSRTGIMAVGHLGGVITISR